jgi:ATP-dependent Zn protease
METTVDHEREVEYDKVGGNANEYREAVRKLIETEVRNTIDEEMKKAAQELLDEQRKAIRQMVEEYKVAIREAVEDEKKAIWTRVEELKKSILKLGLG